MQESLKDAYSSIFSQTVVSLHNFGIRFVKRIYFILQIQVFNINAFLSFITKFV